MYIIKSKARAYLLDSHFLPIYTAPISLSLLQFSIPLHKLTLDSLVTNSSQNQIFLHFLCLPPAETHQTSIQSRHLIQQYFILLNRSLPKPNQLEFFVFTPSRNTPDKHSIKAFNSTIFYSFESELRSMQTMAPHSIANWYMDVRASMSISIRVPCN